jgi:hypothetical protein
MEGGTSIWGPATSSGTASSTGSTGYGAGGTASTSQGSTSGRRARSTLDDFASRDSVLAGVAAGAMARVRARLFGFDDGAQAAVGGCMTSLAVNKYMLVPGLLVFTQQRGCLIITQSPATIKQPPATGGNHSVDTHLHCHQCISHTSAVLMSCTSLVLPAGGCAGRAATDSQ